MGATPCNSSKATPKIHVFVNQIRIVIVEIKRE
jgi:hypothetical protein